MVKCTCGKCKTCQNREWAKRAREKALSQGLCVCCFKNPVREGKKTCQSCIDSNRKRQLVQLERDPELCRVCRTRLAQEGKRYCTKCQEYSKNWVQNKSKEGYFKKYNKYSAERMQRLYWERKTNNLCVKCGGVLDLNCVICSKCKHKIYLRRLKRNFKYKIKRSVLNEKF